MSFIGVVTNAKNEMIMTKILLRYFQKDEILFITDKNVENMKNIHFETIVIDVELKDTENFKSILLNAKNIILNTDIKMDFDILKNLSIMVISYGFQNKATFTVSSVSENNIIICLQRIMKTNYHHQYEPQEFEVENTKNLDVHEIICLQILLLFYEKIQNLVS